MPVGSERSHSWPSARVSKTRIPEGIVGSNPTLSATRSQRPRLRGLFLLGVNRPVARWRVINGERSLRQAIGGLPVVTSSSDLAFYRVMTCRGYDACHKGMFPRSREAHALQTGELLRRSCAKGWPPIWRFAAVTAIMGGSIRRGRIVRSSAHDWKSCIPQGIEGSNPSLSATTISRDPLRDVSQSRKGSRVQIPPSPPYRETPRRWGFCLCRPRLSIARSREFQGRGSPLCMVAL